MVLLVSPVIFLHFTFHNMSESVIPDRLVKLKTIFTDLQFLSVIAFGEALFRLDLSTGFGEAVP